MPPKKEKAPAPADPAPAPPKEYVYQTEAFGQTFKRRSTETLTHAVVWRGTREPYLIWFLDGATAAKKYAAQVARVFKTEAEIVIAKKQ